MLPVKDLLVASLLVPLALYSFSSAPPAGFRSRSTWWRSAIARRVARGG